ncbi:ABC transporter permease [Vallitalea okinawensis]|uniref:ABC transporter permease n=1 Tax=Vallitalea okinawensis TaxID=2078660 RepID=UPI000CFD7B43|nr:ABC transporter permease [Vallitalea okinawensis]
MNNSLLITGNMIKRAFRNKKELLILTLLPILIIGLMTVLGEQQNSEPIHVGYINLDQGNLGLSLIDYINSQDSITLVPIEKKDIANPSDYSFTFLIPVDFTSHISNNQLTQITFYPFEHSLYYENLKGNINQYIASLYVMNKLADETLLPKFIASLKNPPINVSYRIAGVDTTQVSYEERLPSMGFVITFIMLLIITTMGSLLEDKKRLTLARVFTHPVKYWEVITGNLLGSLVLGLLQLIPILITLKIIFQIPFDKQFLGLALILFAFLVTSIGIGIGLVGIIKNNFNPLLIFSSIIIPTSILGGTFIPSSMMPDIINKIAYIVPQKWVMDSIEKVLQGAPLSTILFNVGVILMFGVAFATFGTKTLKPLNE